MPALHILNAFLWLVNAALWLGYAHVPAMAIMSCLAAIGSALLGRMFHAWR